MPLNTPRPPIVWGIAGHDSSGGAGLSADQRAFDAMGVHLCPVVACVTAQQSQGVEAVFALPAAQLDAQLQALAHDMPPRAIKTGLLGSVQAIECVARWVDTLRAQTPAGQDPHQHVALVVDPVLKASAGGVPFSDEAIVRAYRALLLPRATVVTPNRPEAAQLLQADATSSADLSLEAIPDLAQSLQAMGAQAVLVTGGDSTEHAAERSHSVDWLATPHAQGWLTAPRLPTPHHHGTGCTLASGIAAALALGHVAADACVLGKMLTHHALMHSRSAGAGRGPVVAQAGFAAGPAHGGAPLPWLGLGRALPWALSTAHPAGFRSFTPPADGLYGIVATAPMVDAALQAGLRCLQLRHKATEGLSAHLSATIDMAAQAGAQLFINDHWQAALAHPEPTQLHTAYRLGLHLGQEDLQAMTEAQREALCAASGRVMLGLSSHSLWELARAAGCAPSYIACGPVKATTTKDMPWLPQGLDNLRWWVAHSPAPIVAIGGLLTADDIAPLMAARPAAWCVVRGLGPNAQTMREARTAFAEAMAALAPAMTGPPWPHPVLPHHGAYG
jgi:hydroxymethylpyrimidine kinase/phosphomethylpyrimidine kinase/thiamine-phosphate diphosphorylase